MLNNEETRDANSPAFESAAYKRMLAPMALCRDFYAGRGAVVAARDRYLSKFERETETTFNRRLRESDLFPVFGEAIDSDVGLVFRESIAPVQVPEILEPLLRDIDCCGNDLDSFLRETFKAANRDGHAFIMVEAPPATDGEVTADVSADRRPYWVRYEAAQAINWRLTRSNGRTALQQITFREVVNEPVGGFGEQEVTKYFVLRNENGIVAGTRYRKTSDDGGKSEIVQEGQSYRLFGDTIPVYPVYGQYIAPFESEPPRLGLAELNRKHYNLQSNLDYTMSFVRPSVVVKLDSMADAEGFNLSAAAVGNYIKIWGENADIRYLELEGQSIPEFRAEIEALENRMARLSFERLAPAPADTQKTATEVASDNTYTMSGLAEAAKNLENAVDSALERTIEMLGGMRARGAVNITPEERESLRLRIEYDRLTFTPEQMNIVQSLFDKGVLSRETVLKMLPQFVAMPDGWTVEDELLQQTGASPLDEPLLLNNAFGSLRDALNRGETA